MLDFRSRVMFLVRNSFPDLDMANSEQIAVPTMRIGLGDEDVVTFAAAQS